MKDFFSEFGWFIISCIAGFLCISTILFTFKMPSVVQSQLISISQKEVGINVEYSIPEVEENDFVVDNAVLNIGDTFDWKNYVHCRNSVGIDLLSYITVKGEVNTTKKGEYTLLFSLHWNGINTVKKATFYVS